MSDEKYLGGNKTPEILEDWSAPTPFSGTLSDAKDEFSAAPLGFSKALLFPVKSLGRLEITVDHIDFNQCPVCQTRLAKSARYCFNCGQCLKPNLVFENSW